MNDNAVHTSTPCPDCHGTGKTDPSSPPVLTYKGIPLWWDCPTCDGSGQLRVVVK